jgi:PAS domain S-box-containing protein
VASAAERQKLILENRKLRVFNENIVQSLNEGILIEDEQGLISFANPKVEEMFGVPEKKILKTPFNRYIAPEYLDDFKKRKKLDGPAEKGRFESAIKSEEKKQIFVMISTVPIVLGGGFSGSLSVLSDITHTKKLEKDLSEKIQKLEHFNRLMVGRELRMVELKEKIKKLEKELKEKKR